MMGALAQRARAFGAGPIPDEFPAKVIDTLLSGIGTP
jgi:hypothetical protein